MNVLLVDDQATVRKMIKLMLQSRGLRVFDVSNAVDALEASRQRQFDVLVTDVVMEGMDGWTLADLLMSTNTNLLVLFISGYPLDFKAKQHYHSRCAYLPKPFQASDLMNAISELSGCQCN